MFREYGLRPLFPRKSLSIKFPEAQIYDARRATARAQFHDEIPAAGYSSMLPLQADAARDADELLRSRHAPIQGRALTAGREGR